jgi:hypothetical protein
MDSSDETISIRSGDKNELFHLNETINDIFMRDERWYHRIEFYNHSGLIFDKHICERIREYRNTTSNLFPYILISLPRKHLNFNPNNELCMYTVCLTVIDAIDQFPCKYNKEHTYLYNIKYLSTACNDKTKHLLLQYIIAKFKKCENRNRRILINAMSYFTT